MDRQNGHEDHNSPEEQAAPEERRCILCEAEIEMDDHEVYFVTGYCRFCQAALEEDE